MRKQLFFTDFVWLTLLLLGYLQTAAHTSETGWAGSRRTSSPGNTTYYIDPQKGNDRSVGTKPDKPWKSFKSANQLVFSAGDKLEILAAGTFRHSLVLKARGSSAAHVTVYFAPGRYEFHPQGAHREQFHISNTNDAPAGFKAIALYLTHSTFVDILAKDVLIVLRGKMIETAINQCQNIHVEGISFDYQRPTVSELTVTQASEHTAELQIHPDSKYSIRDSLLTWEGEGWRYQPQENWQVLDPQTGQLARNDLSMAAVKVAGVGPNRLQAYFQHNPGFQQGLVYQNRDIIRDCVGIYMQRSKNITWKNIRIYFMHGMGVVSQYCENIALDSFYVKPADTSARTCAAWADVLHFSGCRGNIEVSRSVLSAANDDALNIHGTHLRVVGSPSANQIRVRFMHPQTFGFEAFTAGDSIRFIRSESLLAFAENQVSKVKRLNDKEWLLTLMRPVPTDLTASDVVENTSWTPTVWIHDNIIARIPTRGMLVTTPRRVLIERNHFQRTNMSAILIADDAASWYESGQVHDLTIRENQFMDCGEPVLLIHPENSEYQPRAVHDHIAILSNQFDLRSGRVLSAKSTSWLTFSGNTIKVEKRVSLEALMEFLHCSEVKTTDNQVLPRQ